MNNLRYLVCALTLATTSLSAMNQVDVCESKQIDTCESKQKLLLKKYLIMCTAFTNATGQAYSPEAARNFLHHLIKFYVQPVAQSCGYPKALVLALTELYEICGYDFTLQTLKDVLSTSEMSLCDIICETNGQDIGDDMDEKDFVHEPIICLNLSSLVIKELLKTDPNAAREKLMEDDLNNGTSLHVATLLGLTDIVKLLLEAADQDAYNLIWTKNDLFWTALHIASMCGHIEIMKLFLDLVHACGEGEVTMLISDEDNDAQTAKDLATGQAQELLTWYLCNKP